ncbi:MAG: phytoene/squalene synthase family protein [Flavisolibacter sp.]
MTIELFHKVSHECSKIVTTRYSTSFASAIKLLHKELREPIFNIYGFVRFADEIVDSFHGHDKRYLLEKFKAETFEAIDRGISLNPILNSFQETVREYGVDHRLINAFFKSMESDLEKNFYDQQEYETYIYGSAEAVGLICLHVFCEKNRQLYEQLRQPARALGSAFQKVNFLRDIQADNHELSRMYFPGCNFQDFSAIDKEQIEEDIEKDFRNAIKGILLLPSKAKFGVYVAYKYYYSLFNKIKTAPPRQLLHQRIRISNYQKLFIMVRAGVKNGLRLI